MPHRRLLVAAACLALLATPPLAEGHPATTGLAPAAAFPDGLGVATAQGLAGRLTAAERRALVGAFDLPPTVPLSARLADQAAPGWRALAAKVQGWARAERARTPHVQHAAQRLRRLGEQIAPAPAVPRMAPFQLARYQAAVAMLAGQASRPWPGKPGKQARFTNRLMGAPGNQLEDLADYLADYHRALGLKVEVQQFRYEGKRYRNVAAIVLGRSKELVVLADHFDVAGTWDYPEATLKAEAPQYGLTPAQIAAIKRTHKHGAPVPGADDNASATAALLEAAHLLAGTRPARTIMLLHLNGEEFPGDCYGARQWFAQTRKQGRPVTGVVVMDMIGVNRTKDRIFQLAPGAHPASYRLADMALAAAGRHARAFRPTYRGFDDPLSYLYNTDGHVISGAGFPVLLLNEHVNYETDLERLGYHDEFDRTELFDWPYAQAIATTGIATTLAMAQAPGPVPAGLAAAMHAPAWRAAHFGVELAHSDLYADLDKLAAGGADRTRLLQAVAADHARGEDSVARRMATWFPETGLTPLDDAAVLDAALALRARRAALAL